MLQDPLPSGRARSFDGFLQAFAVDLTTHVAVTRKTLPPVERLPDNIDLPSDAAADRAYYQALVL